MRRGIAVTAVVVSLAVMATACGGDSSDTQSEAKDPKDVSGTITWWDTSDSSTESPAFRDLIKDFEKKYPKIKVKYQNVPFGEAEKKFKTAAQSGSGAPDVIRSEVAWTAEFASLGYLAPLKGTPALNNAGDFLSAPLSSTVYQGKAYAVPQVTDSVALLYNKRLLKKAGIDEPPSTIKELKKDGLKIKEKTGATGFYPRGDDSYFFLPFLYGEGGKLVDAEKKKITVNSPAAVRALKSVRDLVDSGAASKPALADGLNSMQEAFKAGRTAMIESGPWATSELYNGKEFKDKDNLGVAPVPAGSTGKAGAPAGGHNLAVYAGSKHLDASYLFIHYMTSAASQEKITKKIGLLPTRKSAYDRPGVKKSKRVKLFRPIVEKARSRDWIPENGQLFDPLNDEWGNTLTGRSKAKPALDKVADQYHTFLKGWK